MSPVIRFSTLLICFSFTVQAVAQSEAIPTDGDGVENVKRALSGIRIPFLKNHGQTDSLVAYYASTFAGTVYVTNQGELVYALPTKSKNQANFSTRVLKETPVNGNAKPAPGEAAETKVSRFIGNDRNKWQTSLNTYHSVKLGQVWEGIDVSLKVYGNNMEKIYTLAPGADVHSIQMRVDGAQRLNVNEDGSLEAKTNDGPVKFTAPSAWQEIDGKQKPVQVTYSVKGMQYGFKLGNYDPGHAVMIDPLLQSTYLGGSGGEGSYSPVIALDPLTGDVVVAGDTDSTNFPGTSGGAQASSGGGYSDIFIARLNRTLTALLQATYLGGSGQDSLYGIAVHPKTGDIYVTGTTGSTNFPGTSGGAQQAFGGGISDGYVAHLDGKLGILYQSTYLGGAGLDFSDSIVIHPQTGEVYVTGHTYSNNFPGTSGGYQRYKSGLDDAYVVLLDGTLKSLLRSTYLGGAGNDKGSSIAIHPQTGGVYVAGNTQSNYIPGASGGYQLYKSGLSDAFVAHFDSALKSLLQFTYLGGSGDDYGESLAIHSQTGEVYVAGGTYSTIFPGTKGGAQQSSGGRGDVYVARFDSTLKSLLQSTYLGNAGWESSPRIAIHPQTGEVYVTGTSESDNFPGTSGGVQAARKGGVDIFVSRLNAKLNSLLQSTYLGGTVYENGRYDTYVNDWGISISIHPHTGEVYVAGTTQANTFPGTSGGAQATLGGRTDAVAVRLSISLSATDHYTLTATRAGTGYGTIASTDARINCGSDCSEAYYVGTTVTLTAIPRLFSSFAGWTGACKGKGATCVVTMDTAKNVTATFDPAAIF